MKPTLQHSHVICNEPVPLRVCFANNEERVVEYLNLRASKFKSMPTSLFSNMLQVDTCAPLPHFNKNIAGRCFDLQFSASDDYILGITPENNVLTFTIHLFEKVHDAKERGVDNIILQLGESMLY